MKSLIALSLILLLTVSTLATLWGNAGKTTSEHSPKFAMHDWIALEGYKMAQDDAEPLLDHR